MQEKVFRSAVFLPAIIIGLFVAVSTTGMFPAPLNAKTAPACVKTVGGKRLPKRVHPAMLQGLETQFIQLTDDAATILRIKEELDAAGNPEPTAAQQTANTMALNRFSVNLRKVLSRWDVMLAGTAPDWENRDRLARYTQEIDQLFKCVSHFSSYRFQNEPATRQARDVIAETWKASVLSTKAKIETFYKKNQGYLGRRVRGAKSKNELRKLRNEIGQILFA